MTRYRAYIKLGYDYSLPLHYSVIISAFSGLHTDMYMYIYVYIYSVKINGFYLTLIASANSILLCIRSEIALRPPASLSHRVKRAVERIVRD
jgi:hypothetical protein